MSEGPSGPVLKSVSAAFNRLLKLFLLTDLQLLTPSGRVFHWYAAATKKADCPNAVWQSDMVQSHIEDSLEYLIEFTELMGFKSLFVTGSKRLMAVSPACPHHVML